MHFLLDSASAVTLHLFPLWASSLLGILHLPLVFRAFLHCVTFRGHLLSSGDPSEAVTPQAPPLSPPPSGRRLRGGEVGKAAMK